MNVASSNIVAHLKRRVSSIAGNLQRKILAGCLSYSDIANWHDITAMGKSSARAVREEKEEIRKQMLRAIEEDTMDNNALYSQSETYAAALHAYAMSACANPDWQQRKAEQFVARVVRAQNFEHGHLLL